MFLRVIAFAVRYTAVLLSVTLYGTAFAQSTAERAQHIIDQSKRAIVKISVSGTASDGHHVDTEGTGFFVGSSLQRSYLLTAAHVIGSSDEEPSNPDWKVENGKIDRVIKLSSLDEHNNLVRLNGEVHVLPTGLPGVDIALLMIDQGGYPIIPLGDPLSSNAQLNEVMLLAFQKGQKELTTPITIGVGQTSGIIYKTNVPSREGESGGPWIEMRTGQVVAVAGMIRNQTFGATNEATIVTMIRPSLGNYFHGAANATTEPQDGKHEPSSAPTSTQDDTSRHESTPARADFAGLDVIYFERTSDRDLVTKALTQANIKWRKQPGNTVDESNVVTCGSTRALDAAKKLVSSLLHAGAKIKGIAPQIEPISNKLTIEFYPQYENQPVLTEEQLARIHQCPTWSEILSSSIEITNACSYGTLDIYLRYFNPTKEQWSTTARYGLGPWERWTVKDEGGSPVASGLPTVLVAPVVSLNPLYPQYSNYGPYRGEVGASTPALDAIPNEYFKEMRPVTSYSCPGSARR
jgi:hypothetical protein